MIEYLFPEELVKHSIPISKTCDKCKTTYTKENKPFEFQEFHHIRIRGGYGSVWGDEEIIECDFCQHCLYEMIKDYMRVVT